MQLILHLSPVLRDQYWEDGQAVELLGIDIARS